jgi:hypothetical protein
MTKPAVAPPLTSPRPQVGDLVFVQLDPGVFRPLLITATPTITLVIDGTPQTQFRISGTLFCEPEDHSTSAIRTLGTGTRDPARFHGRPERLTPCIYAEALAEGPGLGQWQGRLP